MKGDFSISDTPSPVRTPDFPDPAITDTTLFFPLTRKGGGPKMEKKNCPCPGGFTPHPRIAGSLDDYDEHRERDTRSLFCSSFRNSWCLTSVGHVSG